MDFTITYKVYNENDERIINYIYSVLVREIKEHNLYLDENSKYDIRYKEDLQNCIIIFLREYNSWYYNNEEKLYNITTIRGLYKSFLQTCIFNFEIDSYNMVEVFFKGVLQYSEKDINELYEKSNTEIEEYYYTLICRCLVRLCYIYSDSIYRYEQKEF